MMFYLQPYRKQTIGEQILPSVPKRKTKAPKEEAIAEITR
jgi:hypothetical protein